MKFLKKHLNQLLLAGLAYTPLEPLPGAPPGTYDSLSLYLNYVFKILLSIGAMVAVVTLVLGGITYMVSEVVDKKAEARQRMQGAIIGLLLLLVSWLILYTINPTLTTFSLPGLDHPQTASNGPSTSQSATTPPPNQNDINTCQNAGKTIHYNDTGWTCQ